MGIGARIRNTANRFSADEETDAEAPLRQTPEAARLAGLAGAFLLALAAVFIIKVNQDTERRAVETSLLVRVAADEGARRLSASQDMLSQSRGILSEIAPGAAAAAYLVTDNGVLKSAAQSNALA